MPTKGVKVPFAVVSKIALVLLSVYTYLIEGKWTFILENLCSTI